VKKCAVFVEKCEKLVSFEQLLFTPLRVWSKWRRSSPDARCSRKYEILRSPLGDALRRKQIRMFKIQNSKSAMEGAEDRGQKSEDGSQRTEDRGRRTEGRR